MEVDFGVYGVRSGQKGWRRSTSYHPYELREGTAEEKVSISASGTGKRLLNGHNGSGGTRSHEPQGGDGGVRSGSGGQGRSPLQR